MFSTAAASLTIALADIVGGPHEQVVADVAEVQPAGVGPVVGERVVVADDVVVDARLPA